MPKRKTKRSKLRTKKLVFGDDPIEAFDADWLGFEIHAKALANQLFEISESSGICCGIIGHWGSGKSSFMKLMSKYVVESHPDNACIAWFTAWDPAGLGDLGDAMLYSLFQEVEKNNKDLSSALGKLKEALGLRKSIRERASLVARGIGRIFPQAVGAANAAEDFLAETNTRVKVQECFEELVDWLEKNSKTLFFFVDDIDRATGEQVRDLLSELKVYVAHRRLVVVIGYDEEYVLNALKTPVLPEGTDPKKYLEKIVTIRMFVPVSEMERQSDLAKKLIMSLLDVDEELGRYLGSYAAFLSDSNPRKLKTLILTYANTIHSTIGSKMPPIPRIRNGLYLSVLVISAAANIGLLHNKKIVLALEQGDEDIIAEILDEFAKDSPKAQEIEALATTIRQIKPGFRASMVSRSRLCTDFDSPIENAEPVSFESEVTFNWQTTLIPILLGATKRGFELSNKVVDISAKIVVPPIAKPNISNETPEDILKLSRREDPSMYPYTAKIHVLNCPEFRLQILLTSLIECEGAHLRVVFAKMLQDWLNSASMHVVEKKLVFWIIDDAKATSSETMKRFYNNAEKVSKGLKHPFIVQYTPSEKIQTLLTYLLNVSVGKTRT